MLHKIGCKFKKLFQCVLNAKLFYRLYHYGYLNEVGWFESVKK